MRNIFRRFSRKIGHFLASVFNFGISLKVVIVLLLLVGIGTHFFTKNAVIRDVGGKDDYEEALRYIEIKDIIQDQFIDDVDRKSMGYSAAIAMVAGLGDPWSYFMTDDEYRTYQLSSSNSYSDIGMSLVKDSATGGFQIVSVYPDSPVAAAGVGVGMIIIAVDGEDVTGLSTDEVRSLIRTKINSVFELSFANGQTSIEVDCTNTNEGAINYRIEKTGAAYLQVYNFEAGSGEACVNAIEEMLAQGAVSLVVDVRGNAGGISSEAAKLLDYLLPAGTLFSEVSKTGKAIVTESDSMSLELPMVVLINGESYREAELFAAVLKDYSWATIIGEPTTGNTRSQETIVLEDGSALRLSTRSYLTPNGTDIGKNGGVVPDLIVYNSDPSATGTTLGTTGGQEGTASTSADDQLMEALRYLS